MVAIISYILVCGVPAAVFELCVVGLRRWSARPVRAVPAVAETVDPERFGSTLRRLAADHDRLMSGDAPARAFRLRAVELAYDDTLCDACRALRLAAPPRPLDSVSRVQVEAELVSHGLVW